MSTEPSIFHAAAVAANMRVIILSSGGKDSCYALWWAYLKGWDIAAIVTVQIRGDDSMMFQLPGTLVTGLQASSAEIPWVPITVSGTPELEMEELLSSLQQLIDGSEGPTLHFNEDGSNTYFPNEWPPIYTPKFSPGGKIDAFVTGALRSDYQKTRIERMAEKLGIKSFTPLWHHDPYKHMCDLVEHGFELMLTSVSADGLDVKWLGQILNSINLDKLNQLSISHRFSVDGEGGEFETTVVNAPWMKRSITIQGEPIWTGQQGFLDIKQAFLD
mgnify:FL=1